MVDVRVPRSAETLVLPNGIFERLLADIHNFRGARDEYRALGIPWKRGYLLYGPPGNGKSSLVFTLASTFDADVFCLGLGDWRLDDNELVSMLARVPRDAFLLIEEIETIVPSRDLEDEEARRNRVTMGGLLNVLDGMLSTEGRLVFMTTNHYEKLDSAPVRPGRVDVHLELGNANPDQVERMFRRFYPTAPATLATQLMADFPPGAMSMASLQEHFLRHRGTFQNASRGRADDATPVGHW